nr:uncharacterized protein LOC117682773 isoform X1 [Crassostrea gigas]
MCKRELYSSVCHDRKEILMFLLILQIFSFAGSGGEVYPDCPSPVQKYAFQCFTGYNTQMLNMVKSSATLFSGVDVEIIRAFCSAYNQAMVCIENMKEICPASLHRKIEATLMNLQGAKPEVSALCTDDNIYERYARHMTCLREYGAYSERCFRDGMNSSIRLMQWISEDDIYQLCSDLNRTVDCITSKIGRWCGPEAAQLIPILVKPMVRKSTKCDVMPLSGLGTALMTPLRRRPYRQETITSKPNIFNTPKADTPDQRHVIYANPYNSSASNTPLTSLTVIITSLCGLPYIILHHLHN